MGGPLPYTHLVPGVHYKNKKKPKTIKFQEKNIDSKQTENRIRIFFFFLDVSSGKENKSKYKQMGLHQTKKLLHSKGKYQ